MRELIKESIGIYLKSITYDGSIGKEEKKIDTTEELKLVSVEEDMAELEIIRCVYADIQNSYKLKVVAVIQLFAKEGINLKEQLLVEKLEKEKVQITGIAAGFLSALITQITGSFGGFPVITTPRLKHDTVIQNNN